MKYRSATAWTGALFLLAMAVSIAGNVLILSVMGNDDYVSELASNATRLRIGALFMILNSIAVVGIGALVYQVLRQEHVFAATSYLAARVVEAVTLLFGVISILSLLSIGDDYVQSEIANPAHLLSLADSVLDKNWYSYNIAMLFLGVGSLFFCYVLWKRRMVPRVLSVLGIAGYSILAVSSSLAILDFDLGLAITVPVFLFEVIFGVWLIAKGFRLPDSGVANSEIVDR